MIAKDTILTNNDVIHRSNVRSVYSTQEGRAELYRLLIDLGIFREISAEELDKRNYGIRKLEELGFLDEEIIELAIEWMLKLPATLRRTAEEIYNSEDSEEGEIYARR